jgi:pilus assembly protein Flp/PilA
MNKLKAKMMQLWKDEEGATMVEYGLMVALIAVACLAVVTTLGGALLTKFGQVGTAINAAGTTP